MLARIINHNNKIVWEYKCQRCTHWMFLNKYQLHGFETIICPNCGRDYSNQVLYITEDIYCPCGCGHIDFAGRELKLFSLDTDRTPRCPVMEPRRP